MSSPFLPYGRQWIDEDDIKAVVDVLRGDYLTTGPKIGLFEQALQSFVGTAHAVAYNSGTSALHGAYNAVGVNETSEVITSPLTFAATANAARYLGATVKFVDVDEDTGNLSPALLKEVVTDRTSLIVPVDFGGHPADYDEILPIAESCGSRVISDAAHSLGATYKGRKVGTLCEQTEVSLHPVKPITTGEGGAVLTNNPELAKSNARFRTHGITRDPAEMIENHGPWYMEQQELGFNYRLTDIQAALGLSQIKKLAGFIARRQEIAAQYMSRLSDLPVRMPSVREGVEPGWHLFLIRVPSPELRLPLFERFRELGLGVQVHYLPVYWHPYYKSLGYEKGLCPVAENFYLTSISLPIYPKLTDDEVELSIERIRQGVREVVG